MTVRVLDLYLLREWLRIFGATALGFPLVVMLIELTDNLAEYLARGLEPGAIAVAYIYGLPDKIFLVLPAAVLFATLFSVGAMNRHSEIAAAKASGISFRRIVAPVFGAAAAAVLIGLIVGEVAPPATRRQLELLEARESRPQQARYNFVFRAEEGWTYVVRELDVTRQRAHDLVLEREGKGPQYPTLSVQARRARYRDSTGQWTLQDGRFRILTEDRPASIFAFDSMRLRTFVETPEELLVEPKRPEQMRYAELGRYIDALERSGGDGRKLRVGQALKIAVPMTCLIIALFAAPLVTATPGAGGALGVALGLVTTIVFLTLVQLSRALGGSGLVNPTLAAWLPNLAFGSAGLWLLKRVRT